MLERLFGQCGELCGDGVLILDEDGTVIEADERATKLLDPDGGPLVGRTFGVPLLARDFTELDIPGTGNGGRTARLRAGRRVVDGRVVHACVLTDMTGSKKALEQLGKAREAANAAETAKSHFLANMSHEIRTPMIGILGMIELALATRLSAKQREYLQMARHSADSLLDILNDILDFATIETGKLDLVESTFDLAEAVESAVAPFRPLAERKGLELTLRQGGRAPKRLIGDPGRLRQILVNLVGNAVKFTDRGLVGVEVGLADEPPRTDNGQGDAVRLRFVVRDTGIGIPADKLEAVFDSFTQADGTTARRYQGAGLGLSIIRHLVARMGGQVGVESEEGRGSVFSFTVDMRRADPAPEAEKAAPEAETTPSRSLRVLLAEDNPVNQFFIKELLEQQGHRVSVAHTGRMALRALRSDPVDVVLMDIQMPEMDGIEATRLIRSGEDGILDPNVPIIALTAHAKRQDRDTFLAAGMDDFLPKPVGRDDLIVSLSRVLKRHRNDSAPTPAPRPHPDTEILDWTWLLEKARGNVDFLSRLFHAFVHEQPATLDSLRDALDIGDLEHLGFLAHSLKGAAATMGAGRLKEACHALEKSARGHDADQARRDLEEVDTNMVQVVAAMTRRLRNHGQAD